MSELQARRYYNAYPPNAVSIGDIEKNVRQGVQDPRLVPVKQNIRDNTVGKIVGDIADEKENKGFLPGPIKSILYAFIPATVFSTFNKCVVDGANFSKSPFAKTLESLDNFYNQKCGFFKPVENATGRIFNWIKNTSIVKHFTNSENHIKPVWQMAREQCKTMDQEVIEELLSHTQALYNNKGAVAVNSIITSDANRSIIQIIPEILKKMGIQDVSNLRKAFEHLPEDMKKTLLSMIKANEENKSREVLNKFKEFTNQASAFIGNKESQPVKIIINKLGQGTIKPEEAYKQALKLGEKVGTDDTFRIINNKVQALTGKEGGTFLSKALKKIYAGSNKFFKINNPCTDLISLYFIGDSLKKTIEAPWKEKFSTFTESLFGEVIPFWMLNATTIKFYNAMAGGLKNAEGPWLLRAPARFIGNILSLGSAGDLTHKMSEERAVNFLADKVVGKSKKPALEVFKRLSKRIAEGKGGKATWKALKEVFKTVPLPTRLGVRLKNMSGGIGRAVIILTILMPFVSGKLKAFSHKLFGKPTKTKETEENEKLKRLILTLNQEHSIMKEKGNHVSLEEKEIFRNTLSELKKQQINMNKQKLKIERENKEKLNELYMELYEKPASQRRQIFSPQKPQKQGIKPDNTKNEMVQKYLQMKTQGSDILQDDYNPDYDMTRNNKTNIERIPGNRNNVKWNNPVKEVRQGYPRIRSDSVPQKKQNAPKARTMRNNRQYEPQPVPEDFEKKAKVDAALYTVDKSIQDAEKMLEKL
jgi:hypothetical protein